MNLTLDLQRSLVDLVMADELCDASTADPWQIDDMRGQILDLDEAHSNQMMRCVRYTCCSTNQGPSLTRPSKAGGKSSHAADQARYVAVGRSETGALSVFEGSTSAVDMRAGDAKHLQVEQADLELLPALVG